MRRVSVVCGSVVVAVLLCSGCMQQSQERPYVNSLYGFSLSPPDGWDIYENVSAKIAVRFSPVNLSNVSLEVALPFILSEGLALSTFADTIEQNLSESGMNYTIVYRESRSIPGASAYEIAYSYEVAPGVVEREKQVAILRTRTVFLVTYHAPEALYGKYLSRVDSCVDSFV